MYRNGWLVIGISACLPQSETEEEPNRFSHMYYCSEGTTCSIEDGFEPKGFLNCTKIIVMLSQPSCPDAGAKHLPSTLSHTTESFFSWRFFNSQFLASMKYGGKGWIIVTYRVQLLFHEINCLFTWHAIPSKRKQENLTKKDTKAVNKLIYIWDDEPKKHKLATVWNRKCIKHNEERPVTGAIDE